MAAGKKLCQVPPLYQIVQYLLRFQVLLCLLEPRLEQTTDYFYSYRFLFTFYGVEFYV